MKKTLKNLWRYIRYMISNGIAEDWRDYPIVDFQFSDEDIRSRVKIGWYAFAGERFSPNKDAFPNCQGVIGIINNDLDANKGNRIKIILRHQEFLSICTIRARFPLDLTGSFDGIDNTEILLKIGRNEDFKSPAAEFAHGYDFEGVEKGTAYVPALHELKELSKNFKTINDTLKEIDSSFDNWYVSSSQKSEVQFWKVHSSTGIIDGEYVILDGHICCLMTY